MNATANIVLKSVFERDVDLVLVRCFYDNNSVARLFLDKDDGSVYINELNTIPGFTKFSMFPLLWENTGSAYSKTIERIIELGYERYNVKNNRPADQPE